VDMPIVALAFHEHVAMDKLNRYFESAATAGGETRPINCSKCSLGFAVILVNREDKSNSKHIEDLRKLIEEDCIAGLHKDEYVLTVALLN
jgi:hypothetical protein